VKNKQVPMRKLPLDKRLRSFDEVALGYDLKEATLEAQRCLQCKDPPCVKACPLHVNIPKFIKLLREGKLKEAANVILEQNPFPSICGRVCPQEELCQSACALSKIGEPVAIGRLERFIGDYILENNITLPKKTVSGNKLKIAIVGSGPAGLSAAYFLSMHSCEVTVFEALHEFGGVLVYGIPNFRLPKEIVYKEIERLKASGVKFVKNVIVGKTVTVKEILEFYDAVFIGTGAGLPNILNIPGTNLCEVYSANEFLIRINLMRAYKFPNYDTPIKVGRKVIVIGGGNVAMDVARCARRLGADVTIVYRRTEKEMPARKEEIENAKEEGVKFKFLASPVRIIGENGHVKGVEFIRMKLGEPDESGRRRPIPIPGSEFVMECDTVVFAIGQSPNPLIPNTTPEIKTNQWGCIIIDKNNMTTMPRVFAGGDIVSGAATVVEAVADGKKAAFSMMKLLGK